jgi:hypothetical protein
MFLDNKSMFKLRKECNAEGKISACQRPSFISAVLLNVHQTIIDIKCDFFKLYMYLFGYDFNNLK